MENHINETEKIEEEPKGGIIVGIVSFLSAVVSFFVMFWIFSIISITTGIAGLKNERSRGLCITALVISVITVVLKVVQLIIRTGILSKVFLEGFI